MGYRILRSMGFCFVEFDRGSSFRRRFSEFRKRLHGSLRDVTALADRASLAHFERGITAIRSQSGPAIGLRVPLDVSRAYLSASLPVKIGLNGTCLLLALEIECSLYEWSALLVDSQSTVFKLPSMCATSGSRARTGGNETTRDSFCAGPDFDRYLHHQQSAPSVFSGVLLLAKSISVRRASTESRRDCLRNHTKVEYHIAHLFGCGASLLLSSYLER